MDLETSFTLVSGTGATTSMYLVEPMNTTIHTFLAQMHDYDGLLCPSVCCSLDRPHTNSQSAHGRTSAPRRARRKLFTSTNRPTALAALHIHPRAQRTPAPANKRAALSVRRCINLPPNR